MNINALMKTGIKTLLLGLLLPVMASAQTFDRVKEGADFRIGYVKNATPFSSKGAGDQPEGYSIDLCLRIAGALKEKLGLQDLDIDYTATNVEDGLNKLAGGDIDILCGSITSTLARRAKVSFSIPIFNGGIGALIRDDAPVTLTRVLQGQVARTGPTWRATINQGLVNQTFAVHEGTVTEEWVRKQIANLRVTAKIVTVKEHQEGVDMVAEGKADAYFADRPILVSYASGADDNLSVVDRYFNYEQIALALPRGDEDLRLLADTVLSELYLSGDIKGVYEAYFEEMPVEALQFFEAFALP